MNNFDKMLINTTSFHEAYKDIFEEKPFDYWGYIYFDLEGNYFQIDSDPQIFKHFVENELFLDMLDSEELTNKAFYSCDVRKETKLSHKLRQFVLDNDYIYFFNMVKKKSGTTEIFTVASKELDNSPVNYVLENQNEMEMLMQAIRKRVKPLLNKYNFVKLPKETIDNLKELNEPLFPHISKAYYDQQLKESNAQEIKTFNGFDFELLPFSFPKIMSLDEIKKDIIYLLYFGFSTKQIASILDVSRRTIERQTNSIMTMLHCTHKAQIIYQLILHYKKGF